MGSDSCIVCAVHGDATCRLLCPSCVRAALYSPRIRLACLLTDKEHLIANISLGLGSARDTEPDLSSTSEVIHQRQRCIDSTLYVSATNELHESKRRIQLIKEHASRLGTGLHDLRVERDIKLQTIRLRKKQLGESRSHLLSQQAAGRKPGSSLEQESQHAALFGKIVAERVAHLRALGYWSRLERHCKRNPDSTNSFEYTLGGVPIPDFRELAHTKDGDEHRLTAVLTNISRVLHLASRYLQVRLPAELIVPHQKWPLPMIMSPLSSYNGHALLFPFKSLSDASGSRQGRHDALEDHFRSLPRPRPLFLSRPLQQLASDDNSAYSRFVEALALLCWNIAWLLRTQGARIAEDDWHDACDVGRNLWILTMGADGHSGDPLHAVTVRDDQTSQQSKASRSRTSGTQPERRIHPDAAQGMGVYSHGSLRNYLRAGQQSATMDVSVRSWAMGNPFQILTELKTHLSGEIAMMEAVMVEGVQTAENGLPTKANAEALENEIDIIDAAQPETWKKGWLKLRRRT